MLTAKQMWQKHSSEEAKALLVGYNAWHTGTEREGSKGLNFVILSFRNIKLLKFFFPSFLPMAL
jgi:hypothetical protein